MEKLKLLVQSKGSKKDPAFSEQLIEIEGEKYNFRDYFHDNGVKMLKEELIISSHGNTELDLRIVKEISELAKKGHKIVSLQQGGLYFAKPSLEAANMPTIPVISIPLDGGMWGGIDAFLAPQVPTGTAAIAGVGVGKYDTAARIAKEILTNEFEGVYLFRGTEKLKEKLEYFGIKILGEADEGLKEGLVLGCMDGSNNHNSKLATLDKIGTISFFTPYKTKNHHEAAYLLTDMRISASKSAFVRGEENLAYFAAKIFSAYNPDIKKKLEEEAKEKANSYEERKITLESFE